MPIPQTGLTSIRQAYDYRCEDTSVQPKDCPSLRELVLPAMASTAQSVGLPLLASKLMQIFIIDIIWGLSNNPALFFRGTFHDAALIDI